MVDSILFNYFEKFAFYFSLALVFGFIWLRIARKAGIGEVCSLERFNSKIREKFRKKEGTVTLGGIIILLGLWLFVLFNQNNVYFTIAGIASLLFLFGAFDDLAKILKRRGKGLRMLQKMALHFIIGAIFCFIFYFSVSKSVPYFIFNALFFVFFINALNISDGLNGLAIGNYIILLAFLILGFAFYGNVEMLLLCIVLAGFCLGFAMFNLSGKMFLGDAGAGMLGGILAMIAIFGKMKLFVFIAGMFFIIEGLSSFIQLFGLAFFKKRLLNFACPVHHHFVNLGVSEKRIVVASWIFTILAGLVALFLLLVL
jgi:phospho-N-acetylmuramoyl-pentapeptide-transferase